MMRRYWLTLGFIMVQILTACGSKIKPTLSGDDRAIHLINATVITAPPTPPPFSEVLISSQSITDASGRAWDITYEIFYPEGWFTVQSNHTLIIRNIQPEQMNTYSSTNLMEITISLDSFVPRYVNDLGDTIRMRYGEEAIGTVFGSNFTYYGMIARQTDIKTQRERHITGVQLDDQFYALITIQLSIGQAGGGITADIIDTFRVISIQPQAN